MTTRKKTFLGVAALLAVALVAAFFCRQPLIDKLVDWRVEKNLATCRQAADDGDWRRAQSHAMAALQLNPRRLDSLLALLKVGTEDKSQHRGEVAAVAVRVLHHPAAAAVDKAMALKLFLDAGDGVVFYRLFRKLEKEEQRQTEILQLYATYLSSIGKIADAAKLLETLLARTGGKDQQLALQLAAVLSRGVAGNQGVSERMQGLIIDVLNAPNRAAGLRALGFVQAIPPEQWHCAELLQAADWVDDHAAAGVADRLTIVALRIRKDPAQRSALIDQATSRFRNEYPVIVARWLAVLDAYDRALEVVEETIARQSPEAFVARAQILHQAGRLSDAREWLQTPCNGLRPSVVSTLRAVVASDDAESNPDRWWQKAFQQAELEASADAFWRISASAAAVGNREIEMRAAVEALKRKGAHPSVNQLGPVMAWLYENNKVEDLRHVFQTLIRREPESPMLRNNLAYLEIISGRLDEVLVEELHSLHERFPDVTEFATSLAVAKLAHGEYQEAHDLLEGAVSNWTDAPTSTLAAYAVACELAPSHRSPGEVEKIESLHAGIQWHEMLGQEREFFQSRLETATLSSSLGDNE